MTPSPSRETEIQARLDAATPGPWSWRGGYPQIVTGGDGVTVVADTYTGLDFPASEADLIANAPADLAYLLAENAAKQARIDKALAVVNEAEDIPYEGWAIDMDALRAALTDEGTE